MIEGFRIDVTAEEVTRHLDERIQRHHELAEECEMKAKRVEALDAPGEDELDHDEAQLGLWPGYRDDLYRRAARRRSRELLLIFFRQRVVTGEVYRLSQDDLRSLEWLPVAEHLHGGA
jgi:hypothetical protein